MKLLSWMVLHARSDTANEIEILVLRHQLAVLQRRTRQPQISWTDRAVIATLAGLLPARRRHGFVVTPATILRWHRHLVRRRWTTPPMRAGRPTIPAGVRALTVRLATRIPPGGIGASTANSPDSATRSAPPPHGKSSARPESIRTPADRSDLAAVSPSAGPGDFGLRPVPPRHDHPAPALRVLRHRTRHPPRAHPGRHRAPHRSVADPAGAQPVDGPRRRPPTLPIPHPRPRPQVHRQLQRRVRSHRHRNHKDAGAGAASERDRRTLRRHRPSRTPRPSYDHQPTARRSRPTRIRAPLQRSPPAPQPGTGCSLTTTPPPRTDETRKIQRHDRLGGLLHEYQQVA